MMPKTTPIVFTQNERSKSAAGALSKTRPRLGALLVDELGAEAAAAMLEEMPADDAAAALRHVETDRLERLLGGVGIEAADALRLGPTRAEPQLHAGSRLGRRVVDEVDGQATVGQLKGA